MNGWKIFGIVVVIGLAIGLLLNYYIIPSFKSSNNLFTIDESKNKLAVIIRKNGIYDIPKIQEKLEDFLQAVNQDLNIENVGICHTDVNSLDELDHYMEQLYHEKNVGYVVLIGDDLPLGDNVNYNINHELAYINEKEPPQKFTLYFDIAISLIVAPTSYSVEEKIDFINNVISIYTDYHNNAQNILSQFDTTYLFIKDPFFTLYPAGYQFSEVELHNTQHEKIIEEMKRGHLCLLYSVHGSDRTIGIGLSGGEQDYNKVSTTLEEYSNFIQENGLPALFVEAHHCGKSILWALENMKQGVWAYYTLGGIWSLSDPYEKRGDLPPSGIVPMQKAFSEEPFIGYAVRHHLTDSVLIYGDITAHMI
ncbi:MAG: hypothetical protein KAW45_04325 [Thermoplasmatales archaeon]|nr:hypothetical protein [Thermoplasmatales archaeon]